MNVNGVFILLITFIFVLFTSVEAQDNYLISYSTDPSFELVKSNDGIHLYERWIVLDNNTPARELRVNCTSDKTTLSKALGQLRKSEDLLEWNKGAKKATNLHKSAESWIAHIIYDIPWPFSDQDCVLEYNIDEYTETSIVVSFFNISSNHFPEDEDITRMPYVVGKWVFSHSSKGVNIEFYITTQPSGLLPRWVSDPIVRNNLISTIKSYNEILEKNSAK
ncbi:MAG: hypothetical protein OEY34_09535 [Cyclobacteriaceae bacterium]|nr:hypothetical protein [Cyclobacteriaceae bacterium]